MRDFRVHDLQNKAAKARFNSYLFFKIEKRNLYDSVHIHIGESLLFYYGSAGGESELGFFFLQKTTCSFQKKTRVSTFWLELLYAAGFTFQLSRHLSPLALDIYSNTFINTDSLLWHVHLYAEVWEYIYFL